MAQGPSEGTEIEEKNTIIIIYFSKISEGGLVVAKQYMRKHRIC